MVRLNKYLSEKGVCSRREADRLIEGGWVTVNGQTAVIGMSVSDEDEIAVEGKTISKDNPSVFIAFNKPVGIICTSEIRKGCTNIYQYLGLDKRVFSIGRLDKDSRGLLILTNNGDVANELMRSANAHEKEYVVTVNKPITDSFLKNMGSGVHILDTVTRPCKIKKLSDNSFDIILTQGLNRQIRRMCEALGYSVTDLNRIRFCNVKLNGLKSGSIRYIKEEDLWTKNRKS